MLGGEAELDGDDYGGDLGGDPVVVLVNDGFGNAHLNPSAGMEVEYDGEARGGGGEFGRAVDSQPCLLLGAKSDVFAENSLAGIAVHGGGWKLNVAGERAIFIQGDVQMVVSIEL